MRSTRDDIVAIEAIAAKAKDPKLTRIMRAAASDLAEMAARMPAMESEIAGLKSELESLRTELRRHRAGHNSSFAPFPKPKPKSPRCGAPCGGHGTDNRATHPCIKPAQARYGGHCFYHQDLPPKEEPHGVNAQEDEGVVP